MLDTNLPICLYCKKEQSIPHFKTCDIFGDKYVIRNCLNCQAFFLSPPPNSEQLAQAYDDSYYGEKEKKFSSFIENLLDFFRRRRAQMIANTLPPHAKVLDIGCGNGRFLQYVQKQKSDTQIYGIEMSGKAAKRAAQIEGLQLKVGSLAKSDFLPNTFDAITLFHVFEHLQEPVFTLQTIQQILKPDGLFVLSFPNIDSWQANVFKGKWFHLDPPRHLFFFKPKDFVAEMQKYGFQEVQQCHFSLEYNAFGAQQSLLNLLFQKRELLYEHLKGNVSYTKDYGRFNLMLQNLFFKLTYPLFVGLDLLSSSFKKGATVEFVFRKK